ncbi:hypothetical protein NC661_06475 [Aquibacillus koreensis]|uniref:Uncharacterized protein n=1 Tax=Aquibacillus koreensis TaxID=279446 RepID=A0A9X3WHH1_9BACI|nr:hypothetical protein [Aquibacillus koreensis]MCT2535703.1 hypothetical protein [Aquibacillus koreensis]MDC3420012.1 hypothetical protein [Aquibacillus koreensis]
MKVFRIKATSVGYGEDEAMIVVAESEKQVLEIANQNHSWKEYGRKNLAGRKTDFVTNRMFWNFKDWQKSLIVYEINLSKPKSYKYLH